MIINFNWRNRVICELQIKLEDVAPGYYDQHFIYECRRTAKARDFGLLMDTITKRVNWLLDRGRITLDGGSVDSKKAQETLQRAEDVLKAASSEDQELFRGIGLGEGLGEWISDDCMGHYRGEWRNQSSVREGKGIHIFASGAIQRGFFKDGRLFNGQWVTPLRDGSIKVLNVRDAKLCEGLQVKYRPNGQKEFECPFEDGKKHGIEVTFHENGQKYKERNYKAGKMDGDYFEYDENGTKYRHELWADDDHLENLRC